MFRLNEKNEIIRKNLKCVYIRYSPSKISTTNTPNSKISINIPRGDTVNSLFGSLLRLNCDVLNAATNKRYVDDNDESLVNLGPVALFIIYKLATSSTKHIEEVNHAHIVYLMYKLLTSSRESDDLSIGFDRSRDRRKQQLNNNKK